MGTSLIKLVVILGWLASHAAGQVRCSPGITTFRAGERRISGLSIGSVVGGNPIIKYTGASYPSGMPVPDALNYIVIVPSSSTFPQGAIVAINPLAAAHLKPGLTHNEYPVFTVGQTTVNGTCRIDLVVPAEPNPNIQSVLNSASLQPSLSPGALVSIFGSHLTGPTLSTNYDFTLSYPTVVAGTSVTFNGIAAPLLYLSPGQINGIVPFAVAGQSRVQVVVQRFEQVSATLTLPLQQTTPAIFTAAQGGSGQGAILQQGPNGEFTYNSSGNPAPKGAAVEIFATGMGIWTPALSNDFFLPPSNDVSLFGGQPFSTQPVSLMIGGQMARVLYAGTIGAPFSSYSLLQVNAVVPEGAGSGPQSVVLKIGANDNSQQGVTIWVQ